MRTVAWSLVIGLLRVPGVAQATPNVAITAETKGQVFTTPVNAASYAHAVPSTGSNLALIVTVGVTGGGTTVSDVGSVVWTPDSTVPAVFQTLTCPTALDLVLGASPRRIVMCTLLNPTASAGLGQVTVTLAAAATDSFTSSATTMSGVASFGTPTGSPAGKTFATWAACVGSTSSVCSLAVTTTVDQVLFDLVGQGEPTDNTTRSFTTVTAGQNEREDSASAASGNNLRVATSVTIAKTTSTTLSWTYVNSTGTNGVGQVVLPINAASSVTAARPSGLEAVHYGALGTRVAWKTEEEVSHLGFQVWREVAGARTRLGHGLLPGSMFATGDYPLAGRRQYELWDPRPVPDARYWIQEIGTTGPSRWHGPVVPSDGDPARGRALRAFPSGAPPTFARPFASSPAVGPTTMSAGTAPTERTFPVARTSRARAANVAPDPLCANPPAWGPSVKLAVSATGWYRVDAAALLAAGLPADADPTRLALYADGRPVALRVSGGPRTLAIEFYGTGLDSRETGTHIYWLVADEPHALRVATGPAGPVGPVATSYAAEVERRERTLYFAALLNGPADNFFGATLTDTPLIQTLDVSAPVNDDGDGNKPTATLEVSLQGATLDGHDVQVSMGGVVLGELLFTGRALALGSFDVPTTLLHEGANDVLLTPLTGAGDASLVDHVSLVYDRLFRASGDTLAASLPAGDTATFTGFSSADVRVVDLSDPNAPLELPVTVAAASPGTFAAQVSAPSTGGGHPLLAFTPAGVSSVDAVTANRPSSLCATRGAELAVVAPRAFFEALAPFVASRTSAGWTVDLVDIEDVYDEMSYGAHTAAALTAFVRRRRQGPAAPRTRALLLVGDASFDPRNFLGKDVPDFVPTSLIDTATIETASDDALADLDGDGAPELAVGRWPAHTPEDVTRYVSRTLQFGGATPFARGSLVVAGASTGPDFSVAAEAVFAGVPGTGDFVNAGAMSSSDAHARLTDLWSHGPSFVAYLGHGSQGVWEDLLSMDDLSGTDPIGKPAVVAAMTCLNGFFHDVYQDCLAERLMGGDNGAAAVWASSALEDAGEQAQLALAIEANLQTRSLGEAARQTKLGLPGVGRTMVLFGDPTLFGQPTPDVPSAGVTGPAPGKGPSAWPISSGGSWDSTSPRALPPAGCAVAGPKASGSGRGTALGGGLVFVLGACAAKRRRRSP